MRAVRRTMLRVLIPSALAALAAVASLALSRAPDSRWEEKLRRLDPVRPMDYLELGEEVADEAQTDAEQRLARQLFGLAGALDPQRLGRSAMLALAQFAPTDEARARALAAAELVGGRGSVVRRTIAEPAQLEAFARALSYHRRGEGRRALNALKQENADALLERVGEALEGGAEAFRNDCRTMNAADAVVTDKDIVSSGLYVELALRAGELRGAGLDLFLEGDAPLVEIDLADPEGTWGVDPRRPWWRNGSWAGNG